MPANKNYSVDIIWSEHDGLYLAQVRELPGCIADGDTAEAACRNIRVIMEEWLETANAEGRDIPEPLTLEALERYSQQAREKLQQQVEKQVQSQVQQQVQKVIQLVTGQQEASNIPSWREGGFLRYSFPEKGKA